MKPLENWIKLNTDASVTGQNHSAAMGGVARDSNGRWLWGFMGKFGPTDVDGAELQALLRV